MANHVGHGLQPSRNVALGKSRTMRLYVMDEGATVTIPQHGRHAVVVPLTHSQFDFVVCPLADRIEELEAQVAALTGAHRLAALEAFVSGIANEDYRGPEPSHRREARAILGLCLTDDDQFPDAGEMVQHDPFEPEDQGGDYQAILVERREGGRVAYLALNSLFEVVWVQDADDALHFARRCDAEFMVRDAPHEWDICINSHEWPGGTPRERIDQAGGAE